MGGCIAAKWDVGVREGKWEWGPGTATLISFQATLESVSHAVLK